MKKKRCTRRVELSDEDNDDDDDDDDIDDETSASICDSKKDDAAFKCVKKQNNASDFRFSGRNLSMKSMFENWLGMLD